MLHQSQKETVLMKKRLLTVLIASVMALLLLPLSGCNRYVSSYKAVAFVHTNTTKNAFMSFSSFEGSMVFQLKCGSTDEKINYSAKLETAAQMYFTTVTGQKRNCFPSIPAMISVRSAENGKRPGLYYR